MIPALLVLALLLPISAQAQQQSCLVVGIADGDTLTARCGAPGAYEQIKIRLSAIDAPEKAQAFGNVSRQHLAGLCFQKQAIITPKSKDRYGRTVADVECQGRDAGQEQIQAGLAWFYVKYGSGYSHLSQAESDARANRRGLWADKAPVAPWEFRHPAPGTVQPQSHQAIAGTCITGPRGGRYEIVNGRKRYGC